MGLRLIRDDETKTKLPASAAEALPGRSERMPVPERHFVNGASMLPPYPAGSEVAVFAMGCFWGVERLFWRLPGVIVTGVGYAGGFTPNPTYEEVCTGRTGHAEVVQVVFDPSVISYASLLETFWENHDPTQGMRQGNDIGSQYRSMIFALSPEQQATAEASRAAFGERLAAAGFPAISTEITGPAEVYFAEEYHQQYLAKNPHGYCGIQGLGVSCPVGLFATAE